MEPLQTGAIIDKRRGTVVVEAGDEISAEEREYAAAHIGRAVARAPQPVLFARVVLGLERNPSLPRPATCKAALDVSGRAVRAHVAAVTPYEAIDLAEARLDEALRRLAEWQRADRRWQGEVEPGEWRHGARAAHRPSVVERPREERRLLRKVADATPCAPSSAVFEMELRDHDFALFSAADGGADSVVYRRPDGPMGLLRAGGGAAERVPAWIRPNPVEIPTTTVAEALDRLELAAEPFVFFVDAATRRGAVVYRRFDGHDGLIALEPPAAGKARRGANA